MRSSVDAREAEKLGRVAVPLGLQGESDKMLTLQRVSDSPYRCEVTTVPIQSIANKQRTLPPEMIASDGSGPTKIFSRWARPLIGGRIPRHRRFV